jgi:hypothetical protein
VSVGEKTAGEHALRPVASRRPAILTPGIDALSGGGLSIALILPVLIYRIVFGGEISLAVSVQQYVVLSAILNWPHFMASYRLLYSSMENARRFPAASLYVPAGLLVLFVAALMTRNQGVSISCLDGRLRLADFMLLFASLYLAWHYTGQAWGMTASFAYTSGIRIDPLERRLIRSGCRALLVWHFLFTLGQQIGGLHADAQTREFFDLAQQLSTWAAGAAFFAGTYGFWRMRLRIGSPLPVRVILPWTALFLWYALVALEPDPGAAFFWLQLFHSLQYLGFPIRVEINRFARRAQAGPARQLAHATGYFALLIGAGLVVFWGPNLAIGDPEQFVAVLIASVVNIHHYFVDGAVWKISNPVTRRELFAHLEADAGASASPSPQPIS